jgi:hypothetical protein
MVSFGFPSSEHQQQSRDKESWARLQLLQTTIRSSLDSGLNDGDYTLSCRLIVYALFSFLYPPDFASINS